MPDYFLTNEENDDKFRDYIKQNIDIIRFDKSSLWARNNVLKNI